MRFALITLDSSPPIAGRAVALRQLDFALAAGAKRIVGLGDGGAPGMIALRHAAESAGIRFHSVAGAHGLLGLVGTADDLLVLAPGLLAQSPEALAMLAGGACVLAFPAGAGLANGFERIDTERAWAGALLMPGGLVERLAQLPSDFAPASALLRIALQARVPLQLAGLELAAGGGWAMVGDDAAGLGEVWLTRHALPVARGDVTGRVVVAVLRRFGLELLARDRAQIALLAIFAIATVVAICLAAAGMGGAAFALLPIAVIAARLHGGLARLHRLPFGGEVQTTGLLSWLVDGGLYAAMVLAHDGDWPQRLAAPALLLLSARVATPPRWPAAAAWLADRAVLAALLSVAAFVDALADGAAVLALVLLAGQTLWGSSKSGRGVS